MGSRSSRVYGRLLRLYPKRFRDRFGEGMTDTFSKDLAGARDRGLVAHLLFWVRTVVHVVVFAPAEHVSEWGLRDRRRGLAVEVANGARRLARAPGFLIAATLTLALGIGATTAMFALVKGVVLNPLPYPDSDRLVSIQHRAEGVGIPIMGVSHGTYLHYRELNNSFEEITEYFVASVSIVGDEGAARVAAARVTQGFFELLHGDAPAAGRPITEADQQPGAPRVAVISSELWRARYGGDPTIIGRSISIDGVPTEIVGVAAASFDVPSPQTLVWLPAQLDPSRVILGGFGRRGVARLRPGVTPEQARADLEGLIPSLADRFNPVAFDLIVTGGGLAPVVLPLKDNVVGSIEETLWILLGTVLFVLGIAWANVVNLVLVRAEKLRGEVSLRVALGAGRRDVLRYYLAETLLLGTVGAIGGVLIAHQAIRWVVEWGPTAVPRLHELRLDPSSVAVAATLGLGAGLLLGLILFAGRATGGSRVVSRSTRSTLSGRGTRARDALAVVQVTMALVLLVGAGLMVRTFVHLRGIDPGYDTDSALVFQVGLPPTNYPDATEAFQFQEQVLNEIGQLPGVTRVGATVCLPLHGCANTTPVYPDDAPIVAGQAPPSVDVQASTAGYLEAMGIQVIEGRGLEASDPFRDQPVALVSRNAAERMWPGRSAIGQRIHPDFPDEPPYTVVGVTENVLGYNLTEPPPEVLYLSFLGPYPYIAQPHTLTFVAQTSVDPLSIAPAVRTTIQSMDQRVPLSQVTTIEELFHEASAQTAFAMILLVGSGVVSLLLGAIGVYGVLAYVVSARTNEIGIRMALGAHRGDVTSMVVGQGARVVGIGIVLGLAAAVGLTRLMSAVLFGVQPTDVPTFVTVTLALALIGAIACYIPARRAAAVDPLEALRAP